MKLENRCLGKTSVVVAVFFLYLRLIAISRNGCHDHCYFYRHLTHEWQEMRMHLKMDRNLDSWLLIIYLCSKEDLFLTGWKREEKGREESLPKKGSRNDARVE